MLQHTNQRVHKIGSFVSRGENEEGERREFDFFLLLLPAFRTPSNFCPYVSFLFPFLCHSLRLGHQTCTVDVRNFQRCVYKESCMVRGEMFTSRCLLMTGSDNRSPCLVVCVVNRENRRSGFGYVCLSVSLRVVAHWHGSQE